MVKNTLDFVEQLESKGFEFDHFSPCEWAPERHKNGKVKKDENGKKILAVDKKSGMHHAVPQRKIKLSRPDPKLLDKPEYAWFKDDFQGGWLGVPKGTNTEGGSIVIDWDKKEYAEDYLTYVQLTVIVPTVKGNHMYLLYQGDMHAQHRKIKLDKIPCDLAWSLFGNDGQGIYLPPFSKYMDPKTHEAPITHPLPDDEMMSRDLAYLAGTAKDRVEAGGDNYYSTKSSNKKEDDNEDGESDTGNDETIPVYVKRKIPKGEGVWGALVHAAYQTMNDGLDAESREYIVNLINDKYAEEGYDEANINRLLNDVEQTRIKENKRCSCKLIKNTREDSMPDIIEKCMEEAGYQIRENARGGFLEGRKAGEEEWTFKEEKLWHDYLRVDFQKMFFYDLKIEVVFSTGQKSKYKETKVEYKRAKFFKQDIKEVFSVYADNAEEHDQMKDYLETEAIEEKYKILAEKHLDKDGNIINEEDLPVFTCMDKIVQYEKTEGISKKYPLVDKRYWRRTLWMITYPVVYNTYNPGKRFSEIVLLLGPQGTFKTSICKYSLPEHLQHLVIKGSFREDESELYRKIDQSIFFIYDELDGYLENERKNLKVLGSMEDEYRPLWREKLRKAKRRGACLATSNGIAPLKIDRDPIRRWNPATLYKHKDITKRGIKEGKNTQGFVDYAEEWGEEYREWIWASNLLIYRHSKDNRPGLPYDLNERREEAVKMASGEPSFRDKVRMIVQGWRDDDNKAIHIKYIFDNISNTKKSAEKEEIVLEVIESMGGDGEIKSGRHTIKDADGVPKNRNQQYVDISGIHSDHLVNGGKDVSEEGNENPPQNKMDELKRKSEEFCDMAAEL